MPQLFDYRLRAMRRDRAARIGPELFLLDRAFADCLERIALVQRSFKRALLIGCPDPAWPEQLRPTGANVEVYDPFIEEAHHKRKRDAPSGTALQLEKIARQHLGRDIPTASTRAG